VALEVAAGLLLSFGFELALGFAAAMQKSIGGSLSFTELSLGPLARSAKVDDVAHPALDWSGVMQALTLGFGAKCAHSVATGVIVKSQWVDRAT
jgi:hypothetical protein